MRKFLLLGAACVVLSGTGHLPNPAAIDQDHVRALLEGIFDDVSAILGSFAGGPDDPRSPVTNGTTLASDSARLDAATRKANQLAAELNNAQSEGDVRGR